jgi:molecular chaperone GrpE (heat shock protein)
VTRVTNDDPILREVRRQGRAAIAAQSAAEACLAGLERLEANLSDASAPQAGDEGRALLEALLPFFDALDRAATEAARAPRPGWLSRLGDAHRRATAQAEAFRLLRAQLEATLERVGVEVDRETGIPFDADRHRAVERRPGPPGVIEVVLPGYRVHGRTLREAQVVAGTGQEDS